MAQKNDLDYTEIVKRMIEEAEVKNARRMCEEMDRDLSYAYQLKKRGVSKGFLENYIQAFPNADINYIYRGTRPELPEDVKKAIHTLMSYISEKE